MELLSSGGLLADDNYPDRRVASRKAVTQSIVVVEQSLANHRFEGALFFVFGVKSSRSDGGQISATVSKRAGVPHPRGVPRAI